jgi:DNA-directed RNA polymerase specialized sigma24 family protein
MKLPGLAIAQARFLLLSGRRAAGSLEVLAPQAMPAAIDGGPSVEDRLLGREQLRRAQQALAACSPSAQRTFGLVYEQPGLAHAEVARQMGLSLQRVRQILCEVRQRIRSAIEGDS